MDPFHVRRPRDPAIDKDGQQREASIRADAIAEFIEKLGLSPNIEPWLFTTLEAVAAEMREDGDK